MSRDIALFDSFVPILLLLAIAGAAVTWVIDRRLAYLDVYLTLPASVAGTRELAHVRDLCARTRRLSLNRMSV
jgi:hypothetical protein